jgi:hypothetical protein
VPWRDKEQILASVDVLANIAIARDRDWLGRACGRKKGYHHNPWSAMMKSRGDVLEDLEKQLQAVPNQFLRTVNWSPST